MHLLKLTLITIFIAFAISGCAGTLKNQEYTDQQINDPYKNLNRNIYKLNDSLDKVALKPVAKLYNQTTPDFIKKGISNFLDNLSEPSNFINSFLQFKFDKSLVALTRFTFNSTFGLGGLIDFMGLIGEAEQEEDFGQTLAYWGAKPGAYIMLPLLGPSTVRDTIGRIGDMLMFNASDDILDTSNIGFTTIKAIDTRVDLLAIDDILEKQVDAYSFIRSAYEQSRINNIFDDKPPEEKEDF